MVQASDIAKHMAVRGSDGGHVGTVDHVDDTRITLTRTDSADGVHHHVPLSAVARVDQHVHLNITAAAALAPGGAGATAPRGRGIWPWLVGIVGLVLLLLLFRSCQERTQPVAVATPDGTPMTNETPAAGAGAALPVQAVALPNGKLIDLDPGSLNFALQRYLSSSATTPRTFTFDKLNFDTGSAAIRPADAANVDALAQILAAYPKATVTIVGYTDARGGAGGNAQLGRQRADAVVAALTGKGVDKGRITAASGGEANPADTNATTQGQFENRRTELVVTAK